MDWRAEPIKHRGENRIAVYFEKNAEWIARIKKLGDAKWSATLKAWHLPDNDENRKRFKLDPIINLGEEQALKMDEFMRWLKSKRYSESTIKTYSEAIKTFLLYYSNKAISDITNDDLIKFNNDYILKKNLSSSYQNQIVNGVKLFFQTIERSKLKVDLVHRPKREKILPNVLSKEEVKQILNAPSNIKHRAMLSLIYSCGLRRSELLNLKPNDIDSKRGIIIIRQSKGKKDRIVPLSEKILVMLQRL